MTAEQGAEVIRLLQQQLDVQAQLLAGVQGLLDWLNGSNGVLLVGAACVVVFSSAYYMARSLWGG